MKDYEKESLQKISEFFERRKRKKSNNMAVNLTKISQKMKNKSWLSIEKNTIEQEKTLYYNYKKAF